MAQDAPLKQKQKNTHVSTKELTDMGENNGFSCSGKRPRSSGRFACKEPLTLNQPLPHFLILSNASSVDSCVPKAVKRT